MSIVVEALRRKLLNDGEVIGFVGDRVYPEVAPANAVRPLVVLQRGEDNTPSHYGGQSSMRRHGFRCVASSASREQADEIVEAMRRTLNGTSREETTVGDQNILLRSIMPDDSDAAWEDPADGADDGYHEAALSVMVSWKEQ